MEPVVPDKEVPLTVKGIPDIPADYNKSIGFTMGGDLIQNPRITISLTTETLAVDANTGSRINIATAPAPLTVNVVSSPKLH